MEKRIEGNAKYIKVIFIGECHGLVMIDVRKWGDLAHLTSDSIEKTINVCDGTQHKMQLMSLAGQEKLRCITRSHLDGANMAVICFDPNDATCLEKIKSHYELCLWGAKAN